MVVATGALKGNTSNNVSPEFGMRCDASNVYITVNFSQVLAHLSATIHFGDGGSGWSNSKKQIVHVCTMKVAQPYQTVETIVPQCHHLALCVKVLRFTRFGMQWIGFSSCNVREWLSNFASLGVHQSHSPLHYIPDLHTSRTPQSKIACIGCLIMSNNRRRV